MKKLTLLSLLLIVMLFPVLAQKEVSYRQLVDDQYVPKEVKAAFKIQYQKVILSIWYSSHITYWYEDYSPGWYGNWYPSRQIVVHRLEKPAYYEVDFQLNGNPSRAIYNRYGQWFETRSRIKELPEKVALGLKQSEYGNWMWSEHKEQIFIPANKGEIYRLQVSNGRDKYVVRLNENGEIVQVKYE